MPTGVKEIQAWCPKCNSACSTFGTKMYKSHKCNSCGFKFITVSWGIGYKEIK